MKIDINIIHIHNVGSKPSLPQLVKLDNIQFKIPTAKIPGIAI